ncbi:MAG TPA: protein-L-isoaspartate(D-aspartate) O-methyltransferase [Geobacterales bacterium]|nr:protein-L-isoaspartate(D-aspartate) O-methyltransferase [Geobacterales bacterium]
MERVIEELKELGIIRREVVEKALKEVPRAEFLPEEVRQYAHLDTPIPIGYDQTTSAIHMVSMLCEETELEEGDEVLEIGTGSGYMACVYSKITKKEVFTIEIIPELAKFAKKNLRKLGMDAFIHVINADATFSLPFRNDFDVIIVTACSKDIPKEYIEKLKDRGRLIMPVGAYKFSQDLILIKKIGKKQEMKKITEVAFVPLRGIGRIYND